MTGPESLSCTGLDRTVLPYGSHPESPRARDSIARLVSRPGVVSVYVTGRRLVLVEQAIAEYELPQSAFAITDVRTQIHAREKGAWRPCEEWGQAIDVDWMGLDRVALSRLFQNLTRWRLEELDKQNTHKLSYYHDLKVDRQALEDEMQRRLCEQGVRATLVWNVDEPVRANKLHAIEFLRKHLGVLNRTVFAGDGVLISKQWQARHLRCCSPMPASKCANPRWKQHKPLGT